jgi:hypothetical protein
MLRPALGHVLWILAAAAGCVPSEQSAPVAAGPPIVAPPAPAPVEWVALDPVGEPEPATKAAGKVLDVLSKIEDGLVTTRYQHSTRVREREGLYAWDCSGMAAWVLERSAPKALAAVGGDRPVARDFFQAIQRAPVDKPKRGWQRLGGVADVRPGDVFAWLRPPNLPKTISGHVGFVLEPPRPVSGLDGAYLIRIADATGLPHGDDSRADDSEGGFGSGALLVLTDENGVSTHYGWFGLNSRGFIATQVLFGRVSR